MNIHESAEDYLEKILMLQEQKGSVRSIDIAVAMGFSKPSVSVAMKNLGRTAISRWTATATSTWRNRAWPLPGASMTGTAT